MTDFTCVHSCLLVKHGSQTHLNSNVASSHPASHNSAGTVSAVFDFQNTFIGLKSVKCHRRTAAQRGSTASECWTLSSAKVVYWCTSGVLCVGRPAAHNAAFKASLQRLIFGHFHWIEFRETLRRTAVLCCYPKWLIDVTRALNVPPSSRIFICSLWLSRLMSVFSAILLVFCSTKIKNKIEIINSQKLSVPHLKFSFVLCAILIYSQHT